MAEDARALMDYSEAAEYLGISERFLHDLVAEGQVAVVEFGRRTQFLRPDLDECIADHRVVRSS